MSTNIFIPLEVLGTGVIISYGIALLIKVMLDGIRFFTNRSTKQQA